VDISWDKGGLTEAKIRSFNGGTCQVRTGKTSPSRSIYVYNEKELRLVIAGGNTGDTIAFETQAGKVYVIRRV
jgi:hypothetical protein